MITSTPFAPYPTAHVAQLLPRLRQELALLRQAVAASPSAASAGEPCNPTALLDLIAALLAAVEAGYGLFFAHPTRRLAQTLLLQADEIIEAILCLSRGALEDTGGRPLSECCERLHSIARDSRLAVQLETLARELDEQPETLH